MAIVKKYNVALNAQEYEALQIMMKQDRKENVSQYFCFLLTEMFKSREGDKSKRAVGRPKKVEEEVLWYPSPDLKNGNGVPYQAYEIEAYYAFRKEDMPPLPKPYTKEELKKWDM